MPRPILNGERCKACELCIQICPKKILALGDVFNTKGYPMICCKDDASCIGCMLCAKTCPDAVIEIIK